MVRTSTEGAAEHIDQLAQRYLGGPYPWFGGRDQVRIILTIEPDRVRSMGRRRSGVSAEPPQYPAGSAGPPCLGRLG
ncbi:hypothetical protein ACQRWP_04385 [Micromonospora trifolii]|uniref:hypothetical protein n=1 Tax=Micromonospora trifolii TaxID=2911208 RepID=UPI003D2F0D9D